MRQIRVNEMGAIPEQQKPQVAAQKQQSETVEIKMTQPQQTSKDEDFSVEQAMGFEKNKSEEQKVDIRQGKDGVLFKTVYDSQGRIVEKSAYTEIGASRHLYTYEEDGTRIEKHYVNGKLNIVSSTTPSGAVAVASVGPESGPLVKIGPGFGIGVAVNLLGGSLGVAASSASEVMPQNSLKPDEQTEPKE